MNRFWERVMLALVVCIPVPALALSGLNIPLPSVVERVAAALVPFASGASLEDGATLASGRIFEAPKHETPVVRSSTGTSRARSISVVRVAWRAQPAPPKPTVVRPKAPVVVAAAVTPSTVGAETAAAAVETHVPSATAPVPAPASAPELTPAPTPEPSTPPTREPQGPNRPIEPKPVDDDIKPLPEDSADPAPADPDVKPEEPFDVQPEPIPGPPESPPKPEPPNPEPPKRDPRNEKPQANSIGA